MFPRIDKSYDKNSLRTPDYLVQWLDSIYHFDIDLAASEDNSCFAAYFTEEDNALKKDWTKFGFTAGFLNPPYGRGKGGVDDFICKAITEARYNFTTVMIMPEFNGEKRARFILENAINIIHFNKRIMFIHPVTGKECKNNNRGTMIVEFGKKRFRSKPNHIFAEIYKYDKSRGEEITGIICEDLIK